MCWQVLSVMSKTIKSGRGALWEDSKKKRKRRLVLLSPQVDVAAVTFLKLNIVGRIFMKISYVALCWWCVHKEVLEFIKLKNVSFYILKGEACKFLIMWATESDSRYSLKCTIIGGICLFFSGLKHCLLLVVQCHFCAWFICFFLDYVWNC